MHAEHIARGTSGGPAYYRNPAPYQGRESSRGAQEKASIWPRVRVTLSLAIYAKRDKRYPGHLRFALYVPMQKAVQTPKKVKQLNENPGLPVVTVDLGVNRLAVMGAFRDNQLIATQFIHGGKVRHLDDNAARQVARQIVDFACQHGAKVLVFEYLRKYRPPKEKMSRAGRKNHKRAYWLRGQIVRWVRDLAFREGILRSNVIRPIHHKCARTARRNTVSREPG